MAKVIGIGGIFFKSKDPKALGEWYANYLGINVDPSFGGTIFFAADLPQNGYSIWSPFNQDTHYFEPSDKPYMINFIVDDLTEALQQVAAGGATLHGEPEHHEQGWFGWFSDPDGNKVELWQPHD